MKDFPGGPGIENPPSNAGDTGSSSDQGNKIPPYYLPWGNQAHMLQHRVGLQPEDFPGKFLLADLAQDPNPRLFTPGPSKPWGIRPERPTDYGVGYRKRRHPCYQKQVTK